MPISRSHLRFVAWQITSIRHRKNRTHDPDRNQTEKFIGQYPARQLCRMAADSMSAPSWRSANKEVFSNEGELLQLTPSASTVPITAQKNVWSDVHDERHSLLLLLATLTENEWNEPS